MGEAEIRKLKSFVDAYYKRHKKKIPHNNVPASGKVYDRSELYNLVQASLEGWWTDGKWCDELETKIRTFLGRYYCLLVNSGSSANFLAIKSLTSVRLKERRVVPGSEIITMAAGFPTTINPIIEIGAVPVFVDMQLKTYSPKVEDIERAIGPKTKAVFIAHTLGNPFELEKIKKLCDKHKLWLIEDNCDAFGSKYKGKYTGTFGDIATISFYPAHQITTAEGGAVVTDNPWLFTIIRSMRDWGRDCWCATGKANTCGRRFKWKLGNLPFGYDHKYIYSEIGYNLKMTDLQAAIGTAQIDKLPRFIKKRQENFRYLREKFHQFKKYFILPEASKFAEPCWFGFLLTIKDKRIKRDNLLNFLDSHNVATRLLFAGNITKQPYFVHNKYSYKTVGKLYNTDIIMNDTFWVGLYPALGRRHLDYTVTIFKNYIHALEHEKKVS